MAAIPSKASFTGTTVTQGQFKTALDSLNDYLTGLLGSDGTAATARTALGVINATAPTYAQVIAALGFTPPQPGGTGASGTWPISVSGNAATASQLNSTAGAGTYNWSGQAGQPTWLWGGNDGTNFYVYNPSNFSVNYAGSAGSVLALLATYPLKTIYTHQALSTGSAAAAMSTLDIIRRVGGRVRCFGLRGKYVH